MIQNIKKCLLDKIVPVATPEMIAEIDNINIICFRALSLLTMIFQLAGVLTILLGIECIEDPIKSFISVFLCLTICAATFIITSIAKRRGRVNHRLATSVIVSVAVLLIIWGMMVSYLHYIEGDQILTFFSVFIAFTCFAVIRPYISITIVSLSFIVYYVILYAFDGAPHIQMLNYFSIGLLFAAGSVARYNLTLKMLKSKREVERLNESLKQDVKNVTGQMMEKELELSKIKIRLMQHQISPHFIFNSLGVIKSLIYEDQDKAADCLKDFSVYLRRNIEILESETPIFFDKEIEHIKAFLALETADSSVDLMVEYDTEVTNFSLPPLTVEPLVENAVIHGTSPLEHGARIRIATREDESCYIISVEDNGVGFQTDDPQKSGVGIENVRTRLHYQCNSRLEIKSGNTGTTATIYIPKEGQKNEGVGA